jgi:hypothetical protein
MRRLRLQISLRSLLLLVGLAAVYLGCWDATKRFGTDRDKVRGGGQFGYEVKGPDGTWYVVLGKPPPDKWSPAPFVVFEDIGGTVQILANGYREMLTRRYYIWIFGIRFRLPYESRVASFTAVTP